jgi:hypothetical protein
MYLKKEKKNRKNIRKIEKMMEIQKKYVHVDQLAYFKKLLAFFLKRK